jgi:hypothetical protein
MAMDRDSIRKSRAPPKGTVVDKLQDSYISLHPLEFGRYRENILNYLL